VTPLETDVRYIKGVGEARAKALAKLGIHTLRDLVAYFPRAYEDRTAVKPISLLTFGESACVAATVASQPKLSRIRKGLDLVQLRVVDAGASMKITFFNQSYVRDSLKYGESYVFYGKVGGTLTQPEMINPVFEPETSAGRVTGRIVPVYGLTAGVSRNMMVKAVEQGLSACGDCMPDPMPHAVRESNMIPVSKNATNFLFLIVLSSYLFVSFYICILPNSNIARKDVKNRAEILQICENIRCCVCFLK